MKRPTPINEEIQLDPKRYIVSKTDPAGVITYANDYFTEICQYTHDELIGYPHNIVRHPDMPRIAFKLMWETIKRGESFRAVVKNLAKDGRYYWVLTDFECRRDPKTNEIVQYTAYRKAAPRKAIETIIPVYAQLIELEKVGGMEASEKYLRDLFNSKHTNYNEFINKAIGTNTILELFFAAMKKLFK